MWLDLRYGWDLKSISEVKLVCFDLMLAANRHNFWGSSVSFWDLIDFQCWKVFWSHCVSDSSCCCDVGKHEGNCVMWFGLHTSSATIWFMFLCAVGTHVLFQAHIYLSLLTLVFFLRKSQKDKITYPASFFTLYHLEPCFTHKPISLLSFELICCDLLVFIYHLLVGLLKQPWQIANWVIICCCIELTNMSIREIPQPFPFFIRKKLLS